MKYLAAGSIIVRQSISRGGNLARRDNQPQFVILQLLPTNFVDSAPRNLPDSTSFLWQKRDVPL